MDLWELDRYFYPSVGGFKKKKKKEEKKEVEALSPQCYVYSTKTRLAAGTTPPFREEKKKRE